MARDDMIIEFLRDMKGARLSTLVACWCAGEALTNTELQRWTGYNKDTLRGALHDLAQEGWLEETGPSGPWRCNPLRRPPFLEAVPVPAARQNPSAIKEPKRFYTVSEKARKEREEQFKAYLAEQAPVEQQRILEALKALREEGIGEPKATELAMMPHIVPSYVHQHVQCALADHLPRGTAISRMENGWAAPTKRNGRWQ